MRVSGEGRLTWRCALRSAFFLRSEAMSVSPKGSPLCVKWLLYFLKKLLSGRKSVARPMREGARSMIVTRPSRELPLVMPICGSKRVRVRVRGRVRVRVRVRARVRVRVTLLRVEEGRAPEDGMLRAGDGLDRLAVLQQHEQVRLEQRRVDGQVGGDDGRGDRGAVRVAAVDLVTVGVRGGVRVRGEG